MYMRITGFLMAVMLLAGCAVVHVYVTFPEEKIERAAEDLLAPPSKRQPQSNRRFQFTREAYAQEVQVRGRIRTDSPVIQKARERMDTWREKLDEFKAGGFVGETNDFKVVVRSLPSDSSVAREIRQIVNDENKERRAMMGELIKINSVAPGDEKTFRGIFAEVSQRYSPEGTWIQDREQEWKRKDEKSSS